MITETLVHDLRSPLSAVLGALDVMSESLKAEHQSEVFPQALQLARRSSRRVMGMVESLLDISRMQAGSMDLNRTPVSLPALVVNILVDFTPQSQDYGVELVNTLPPDFPAAWADQGKLSRILTNLLDNALKFTPAGGRIIFGAELKPEGMLTIRVADTGPGIPVEYREKIFERFTQIPGQRGRRRGSGLGLTFCRLAVEAHGGKIWVESNPGGGSVFQFTLPVASNE
jgi:signal transduction histidine kinase